MLMMPIISYEFFRPILTPLIFVIDYLSKSERNNDANQTLKLNCEIIFWAPKNLLKWTFCKTFTVSNHPVNILTI
jgi:hypothetical protein